MVDNVEEFGEWVDDEPDFGLDITGVDTTIGSGDDRPEKPKYEKAMKYDGFDMGKFDLILYFNLL